MCARNFTGLVFIRPPPIELTRGRGIGRPKRAQLLAGFVVSELIPRGGGATPVRVSADRLMAFLTNDTGVTLDIAPRSKEKDSEGNRSGEVTINWLDGGITQFWRVRFRFVVPKLSWRAALSAPEVAGSTALNSDTSGRRTRTPRTASIKLGVFELNDILAESGGAVYGLGRVRLTEIAAGGDLKTGRSPVARAGPLPDLFYSIAGGVVTVIDFIKSRFVAMDVGAEREQLAAAMVTRFQQRVGLELSMSSVLLEGLVILGTAMVDRVKIGAEGTSGPGEVGLAFSITSLADWDRLIELRKRWSAGELLSPEEREKLSTLERQALGFALGVTLQNVEVEGVRAGKAWLQAKSRRTRGRPGEDRGHRGRG